MTDFFEDLARAADRARRQEIDHAQERAAARQAATALFNEVARHIDELRRRGFRRYDGREIPAASSVRANWSMSLRDMQILRVRAVIEKTVPYRALLQLVVAHPWVDSDSQQLWQSSGVLRSTSAEAILQRMAAVLGPSVMRPPEPDPDAPTVPDDPLPQHGRRRKIDFS